MKLTDLQKRVIDILGHDPQTAARLAYTLGRKESSCRFIVQRLKARGLITSHGRAAILFLTPSGRVLLEQGKSE